MMTQWEVKNHVPTFSSRAWMSRRLAIFKRLQKQRIKTQPAHVHEPAKRLRRTAWWQRIVDAVMNFFGGDRCDYGNGRHRWGGMFGTAPCVDCGMKKMWKEILQP